MTYFRHHQALASGQTLSYTGPEADHLLKSRRMRPGDTCLLQDPEGRRFRAEISTLEKRGATLRIGAPHPVPPLPALRVTLLQAAVKDKAAELIVQKATELGVAAIHFFAAGHGTVPLRSLAAPATMVRWERIAWEACKQCDRQFPPALSVTPDLAGLLGAHPARPEEGEAGWLLYPAPDALPPGATRQAGAPLHALHLLTGPEGGLTDSEIAAALAAGYAPVTLGPLTLRAETAALAACAAALLG